MIIKAVLFGVDTETEEARQKDTDRGLKRQREAYCSRGETVFIRSSSQQITSGRRLYIRTNSDEQVVVAALCGL